MFTGLRRSTLSGYPVRALRCARGLSEFPRIESVGAQNPSPLSEKQQHLLESLKTARKVALAGGGPKAIHRHTEINKKILPRERLHLLLDEGAPFLELSSIAGHELEYGSVPCGGSISIIGRVSGTLCMVSATEATVKGGSIYPITLKKQMRAQTIAIKNRLPIIYITDSGGAFLPLQSELFVPGGQMFRNQAVMSSLGIPQLALVCGMCTAGAAYIPSMADEAIIIKGIGAVFLAGPPLLKAATGEIVSAEELGGADVHCRLSGGTDHYVTNEQDAYTVARHCVMAFNSTAAGQPSPAADSEPLVSPEQLASCMPCDGGPLDMHMVLAGILDGSRLHEFKKLYGQSLIVGFAHVAGRLVGVIANNGPLCSAGGLKGAHFTQICSTRNIPLLFIQHTEGAVGNASQDTDRSWMRAVSKLIATVSCAQVPKVSVIVGDSCGVLGSAMAGAGLDADFVFSWPSARMAAPGAEVVRGVEDDDTTPVYPSSQAELFSRLGDKASPIAWSARLLDDGVICPTETRQVLCQALEACATYRTNTSPNPDTGVLRM